jgi:hypothetical protein
MHDIHEQLGTYWTTITKQYPTPDADKVMAAPTVNGAEPRYVTNGDRRVMPIPPTQEPEEDSRGGWVLATAAVVVAVVAVGGMYMITRPESVAPADDVVATTVAEVTETSEPTPTGVTAVIPSDAAKLPGQGYVAATGGTPLPDIVGATLGDSGEPPLPMGAVTELPGDIYLDFLYEFPCGEATCFRDAVFKDVNDPGLESGPFPSGTAFHVRHGFVNDSAEPLGDGFDVALYVFPMDQPGEYEGLGVGETVRYTSDYVIRGETEQCGPTYNSQAGTVSCEWFVHEFPDGLPDGRFALWAVWEAPCSAWVEMGYTESCANPDEVVSFFSSGVDSPFGDFQADYGEVNDARR